MSRESSVPVSRLESSGPWVAFSLWHPRGVRDDPEPLVGLAHLFEHLWLSDAGPEYRRLERCLGPTGLILNGETGAEHMACRGLASTARLPRLLDALMLARRAVTEVDSTTLGYELERLRAEHASRSSFEVTLEGLRTSLFRGHALARPPSTPPNAALTETELRTGLAEWRDLEPQFHSSKDRAIAGASETAVEPRRASRRPPLAPRPCARLLGGNHETVTLLQAIPLPGLRDARWPALRVANLALFESAWSGAASELRKRAPFVYRVRTWLEGYSDCGIWWLDLQTPVGEASRAASALYATLQRTLSAARSPEFVGDLIDCAATREAAAASSLEGRLAGSIRSARGEFLDPSQLDPRHLTKAMLYFLDTTAVAGLRTLSR